MAGKRKVIQALVDSMIGGTREPSFTPMTSEKVDMVKGLNFYAVNYRFEHSKAFALKWAKANMPEIYPSLKAQKDWRFGSYGFVLRMMERGFVLSEEQLNKVKAELRIIASIHEEKSQPKQPTTKQKQEVVNKALETFEVAVDDIIAGGSPTPSYGVNTKDNKEVIALAERMEGEMMEHPDDFKPSTVKVLRKFLRNTKAQLLDTVKKVKTTTTVRPKRTKPSAVVVKSLRHKMVDEATGVRGVAASKLVGAKRALVYHSASRQLAYFEALGESGLTVSGTTLKNYDPDKSFMKIIRKPHEMVEALDSQSMVGMRKWLAELKTRQQEARSRFNEDSIVLRV